MRSLILLFISTLFIVQVQAQGYLPGSYIGNTFSNGIERNFSGKDSISPRKWSLNKYSGISTSFTAWKGRHASTFAVPMGIQLNRRINNNFYAFAGVSVAPAYVNFQQSFLNGGNKIMQGNSLMYRPNSFGMYSRAELGLMYTNDEHTFQISGSFGIERRQFPQARDFQILNTTNNKQPITR